jgi:hypothetical protein
MPSATWDDAQVTWDDLGYSWLGVTNIDDPRAPHMIETDGRGTVEVLPP